MSDKAFNHLLLELMQERNLSARQLAKKLGLPQKTVNDWVGPGGSMPRDPAHLRLLADFFSISVHFLLFGTEDRHGPRPRIDDEEVFTGVFEISIRRMPIKTSRVGKESAR